MSEVPLWSALGALICFAPYADQALGAHLRPLPPEYSRAIGPRRARPVPDQTSGRRPSFSLSVSLCLSLSLPLSRALSLSTSLSLSLSLSFSLSLFLSLSRALSHSRSHARDNRSTRVRRYPNVEPRILPLSYTVRSHQNDENRNKFCGVGSNT